MPESNAAHLVADKLAREGASPNTVKQYRARIAGFLESELEALDYIGEANLAGRLPEARQRCMALRKLKEEGLWPSYKKPLDTFPRLRKAHPAPVPYISPERAREFFMETGEKLAKSVRDLTAMRLFYASGCRQQELVRALKSDLFTDGGDLLLRVQGKGRKPREIPLPRYAQRVIERYERWERPAAEEINRAWAAAGNEPRVEYLILGEQGGPLYIRPVQELVHACCDAMAIPRAEHPLHMIRSWYATHMLENGCELHDLSLLMGHSSVRETMPYLLRNPANSRRVVQRHHAMQDWPGAYKDGGDTLERADAS